MVKAVGGKWSCGDCGLVYGEMGWAEKCEQWCLEHHSCNLAITSHADK